MSDAQTYECDQCGLCCKRLLIEADALDVLREPRLDETRRKDGGATCSLPILDQAWLLNDTSGEGMACRFLGEDNRCGIYATRQNTCVGFQAGSMKCQELRQQEGLPPLESVTRVGVVAQISAAIVEDEE